MQKLFEVEAYMWAYIVAGNEIMAEEKMYDLMRNREVEAEDVTAIEIAENKLGIFQGYGLPFGQEWEGEGETVDEIFSAMKHKAEIAKKRAEYQKKHGIKLFD